MATRLKGRRPAGVAASTAPATAAGGGWSNWSGVTAGRRRKYVSGATQAQVLDRLRQAQREAEAGVVADERLTVRAFLDLLTF